LKLPLKRMLLFAFILSLLPAITTPRRVFASEEGLLRTARLELSTGYRTDDLDWNIAGDVNGKNPSILSELSWEGVDVWQLQAEGNIDISNNIFPWLITSLKGTAGYGWIVDGRNRDSDYDIGSYSTEESRSINDAGDGSVLDLSVAIGPHFSSNESCWSITPFLGYSYHEQRLTMTNGQQVIPTSGVFDGLDSTYDTEWSGPWLGADIVCIPVSKWTFTTSVEYHWVDYSAEADWNLRDDFQHPRSFKHEADGDGWVAGVGISYAFNGGFSVGLSGSYLNWKTNPGIDRLFLANGTHVDTRLNEVNWESTSLSVTLGWDY